MDRRLRNELASHRTSLDQAGETDLDGRIEDSLRWSADALGTCTAAVEQLQSEFQQIHDQWFRRAAGGTTHPGTQVRPDYYQTKGFLGAAIGGWAISLLEVLFTTGTAQIFLNAQREVAWAVGFTVAALIAIANKGFFAPIATTKLQETPKKSRDRLLRSLGVITVPELGLLYLLLAIARGSSGLDKYLGLVMGALSLLTPVIAGLLFGLSTLLGWSRDLTNKIREWQDLARNIHGLEDAAAHMAEQRTPGDATETLKDLLIHVRRRQSHVVEPLGPRDLPRGDAKNIVSAITLILLLSTFTRCREKPIAAQPLSLSANSTQETVSKAARGEIWDDGTVSVDATDLPAARTAILSAIRSISSTEQVSEWKYFEFADSAWKEQSTYAVPVPGFSEPVCKHETDEAGILFRRDNSKAEAECATARQRAHNAHEQTIGKSITEFAKYWNSVAQKDAHCTSIHDVLQRLSQESGRVRAIVITDGVETCLKEWPAVSPPRDDVRVVVVLVSSTDSSKAGSFAADFDRRRSSLLQKASWIVVVPPWKFEAATFSNPASGSRIAS